MPVAHFWGDTNFFTLPIRQLLDNPYSFLEAVHPDDRLILKRAMQIQEQGQSTEINYRIIRPNGEIRWIQDTGVPVFNAAGKAVRATGIAEDITVQKLANEALKRSEEKFRTFTDAMPILAFIADPKGNVIYINKRWHEFNGVDLSDTNWNWNDNSQLHPEDWQRACETWTKALEAGHNYQSELRLRRHDNTYLWHLARAVPLRDEAGNITQWLGNIIDISDQKTAHFGLQTVLDTIPLCAGVLNTNGIVTMANQIAAEAFGETKTDALGRYFWDCSWWAQLPDVVVQLQ